MTCVFPNCDNQLLVDDLVCFECAPVIEKIISARASQRTKASLASAKERGVKLGNPNPEDALKKARRVRSQSADEFAESMRPVIKKVKENGARTLQSIASSLNGMGHQARRGGLWSPTQVMNLLERLKESK